MGNKDYVNELIQNPAIIFSSNDPTLYQYIPQALIESAKRNNLESFEFILNSPNLIDWSLDPIKASDAKISLSDLLDVSKVILRASPNVLSRDSFNDYEERITETLVTFLYTHYSDFLGLNDHEVKVIEHFSNLILHYLIYHDLSTEVHFIVDVSIYLFDPKKRSLEEPILMYALKQGFYETLETVKFGENQAEIVFWCACVLGDYEQIQFMRKYVPHINFQVAFMLLLKHGHHAVLSQLVQELEHSDSLFSQNLEMIRRKSFDLNLTIMILQSLPSTLLDKLTFFGSIMDPELIKLILTISNDRSKTRRLALAGSTFSGDVDTIKFLFSKEQIPPFMDLENDKKIVLEAAFISARVHMLDFMDKRNWITADNEFEGLANALVNRHWDVIEFLLNRPKRRKDARMVLHMYLLSDDIRLPSFTIITHLIDRMIKDKVSPQEFFTVHVQDKFVSILSRNLHSLQYFTQNEYTKSLITAKHLMELLDASFKKDQIYLARYILSRPDLLQIMPKDKVKLFIKMQQDLLIKDDLATLEKIYNGKLFDSTLGDKLVQILQTKNPLEHVLSIQFYASSFDIFCFQQIALVAVEFVKNSQNDLFNLILKRKQLVDWKVTSLMKPMNYPKNILRPIDILEIAKVVFHPPVPDSLVYNNIMDDIKTSFSEFIMENLDQMVSVHFSILTIWMDYLVFEGKVTELKLVVDLLTQAGVTNVFPKQMSMYYMLKMDRLDILEMLLDDQVLSMPHLNIIWNYALFKGDIRIIDVIVKHGMYLVKQKYTREKLDKFLKHFRKSITSDEFSKKTLDLIVANPKSLNSIFYSSDYELVQEYLSHSNGQISDSQLFEIAHIIGETGDMKMISILLNYLLGLKQDVYDEMIQILHTASVHNQNVILHSIPNLHDYKLDLENIILHALKNHNTEVADFFTKAMPNVISVWNILNFMIYLDKDPISHILIGRISSQTNAMYKSKWFLQCLVYRSQYDIQFLQFAIHHYYLGRLFDEDIVRTLMDSSIDEGNIALADFILSEIKLYSKLSIHEWKTFEQNSYIEKKSALKKVFKLKSHAMYRSHPEKLSRLI